MAGIGAAASMLVTTAVISTGAGMIAAPAVTELSKQLAPESQDTAVTSVTKEVNSGSSADAIVAENVQAIKDSPDASDENPKGKTVPEPPATLLGTGLVLGAGVLLKLVKKKKILKADTRSL